jgi:hypothetical protein
VLVRGFPADGGDRDDHHVPQLRVRPGHEVGQPGLLGTLPNRDRQRVVLARVAVPADLEPRLLPLMPAQQDLAAAGVDDQC